jgi:hypothetical protein
MISINSIALSTSLLGLSLATGCVSNQTSSNSQGVSPASYQPEGASNATGLSVDLLPDPINLSESLNDSNAYVRRTITPTVIDTRDIQIQRQLTGPFTGDINMIKHELPKHSRDKSLPLGDLNRALPVGQAIEMDRVNVAGGTGYEAISQTEWSPPDPSIAVGPNHIVETVNAAIAFYDRDGNETFSSHLGTPGTPGFFETVGASSNFVFDPKCFYDQKTGRFVVIALEQIGETESWIDIAVSDDSDPNGIWYKYRTFSVIEIGVDNFWVDYPGFGFDDNAFYVTGNLFFLNGPSDGGFGGALFRVYDKAPMLNGDPVVITDLAPGGASVQVAQMFGPSPQCFFLSRDSSTSMRVWTINDPLGTPTIESTTIGGLDAAFSPFNAPNLDGGEISTLDGRLMNVHYRDGNLYTAHGIEGDSSATVGRWYHFDLDNWPAAGSNPSLVQQGEVSGDGDQHYYFPAIYSDSNDHVGMIMTRSSSSEYASVQVSGRIPSDPLGTMSEPIQLAIGDRGTSGRWGDYLDIAIDPNDDTTFWIVGMYARNFGWQTWIDSFTVGTSCPADLTGDGTLNFFDISTFLDSYSEQDPTADINGDGEFNFFDITEYLALFSAGCP